MEIITNSTGAGAEAAMAAMEPWEIAELGRKTYDFVRRIKREHPELLKAAVEKYKEERNEH